MGHLILVRGLPGSGKSTEAKKIAKTGYYHFEADQYFITPSGEYKFDKNLLKTFKSVQQVMVYITSL